MSIRVQNDIEALQAEVARLLLKLASIQATLEEHTRLFDAMTRQPRKDRAA